jgi:hypothetical protein
MQTTISANLVSTYELIKRAFPDGIDSESYLPLLALLYDEMSDRCLAEVISCYTSKDYYVVLNDVYKVGATDFRSDLSQVKQRLLACGYQQWLEES